MRRALLPLLLSLFAGARVIAGSGENLFLEVVINGWPTGEIIPFEVREGHFYTRADTLRALTLILPAGEEQIAVDRISGVQARYDAGSQRLYLNVPPSLLQSQTLRRDRRDDNLVVESGHGVLFNYDAYANRASDRHTALNVWNELRWFGSLGVVNNNGVYRHFAQEDAPRDQYIRYDTQWVYSDPLRMQSVRVGDVLTGGLSWTRPLRVGGAQVSRNFQVRPEFVSYPLPEFIGQSTVPSSVELFINNLRAFQSNVRPGPFTIETAPFITGAGSAQIVTTDALGRQSVATIPFYVSSELLRPGLADFALTLGQTRRRYGIDSFDYSSRPLADGSLRYGVNDWLTVEGHAEGGSGLINVGGGALLRWWRWGVFSGSLSHSDNRARSDSRETREPAPSGAGHQYAFGYSYYSRLFTFNAQTIRHSDDYTDLGSLYGSNPLRRIDQILGAVPLGRQGAFSVGYFAVYRDNGDPRQRFASLSFTRPLPASASATLSYSFDLDHRAEHTLLFSFSLPLGENRSANLSHVRDSRGGTATQLAAYQAVPYAGGWGWGLSAGAGGSGYREAMLNWRGDSVDLSGGVLDGSGSATQYWADARGALGMLEGQVFLSNYIPDAFALVDTGAYSDVPVRFSNQSMGSTDSHGHRVIPWLSSYSRNYLEIDPRDLPVDTMVSATERYVRPAARSGVRVDFSIERTRSAVVILTDGAGRPLPVGTRVRLPGSEQEAVVGWDGQAYLQRLETGDIALDATTPDGAHCRSHFTRAEDAAGLPTLGPLTCQ